MILSVLNNDKNKNSQLQTNCIMQLDKLFIESEINDAIVESYFFEGVRGKYDKLENYCICFHFNYFNHSFEFELSYDQLEYYITNEEKLLKECNLEDFWEDKIMIEKFIIHLKKDLAILEIPFNNIES